MYKRKKKKKRNQSTLKTWRLASTHHFLLWLSRWGDASCCVSIIVIIISSSLCLVLGLGSERNFASYRGTHWWHAPGDRWHAPSDPFHQADAHRGDWSNCWFSVLQTLPTEPGNSSYSGAHHSFTGTEQATPDPPDHARLGYGVLLTCILPLIYEREREMGFRTHTKQLFRKIAKDQSEDHTSCLFQTISRERPERKQLLCLDIGLHTHNESYH